MVPESATAVVSSPTSESCWPLDAFCQGTPAQVWNLQLLVIEETYTVTIIEEICSWINSWKMELMVQAYLALLLNQNLILVVLLRLTFMSSFTSSWRFAGEKLGIAHVVLDGAVSMNAGVFHFSQADNTIALNIRYPQVQILKPSPPWKDRRSSTVSWSLMVTHLLLFRWMTNWYPLSVFTKKQAGLKGHEQVIGGGAFGRLLKRGVAFWLLCSQDYVNTMHQANESQMLKILSCSSYLRRNLYELIK